MLPKQNRLKKMKDFEILFKEGKFINGNLVDLKIWQIESEKYPKRGYLRDDLKIGFVVTKKISKSAVKRNRIKRQMREAVRLLLKENKIKPGSMVLVMAKTGVLEKDYQEIEKSIIDVLKKSKIYT